MKKALPLKLILAVILITGCTEVLTYEEFKAKYDWAEIVCATEILGDYCTFSYNGVQYSPVVSLPSNYYTHYWILIDKNAPDKNFIIQRDKPIKPIPLQIVQTKGKIKGIYRSKNYLYVEYLVRTDVKLDLLLRNKAIEENWRRTTECVPLSYYNKLHFAKEHNYLLSIDFYITEIKEDGFGSGQIFINRESLEKINL